MGVGVGRSHKEQQTLAFSGFYTYSFGNKGIFGGVSLDGVWLKVREGANGDFYGSKVRVKQILTGKLAMPKENGDYDALIQMLNQYALESIVSVSCCSFGQFVHLRSETVCTLICVFLKDLGDLKVDDDDDEKLHGETQRITVYVVYDWEWSIGNVQCRYCGLKQLQCAVHRLRLRICRNTTTAQWLNRIRTSR